MPSEEANGFDAFVTECSPFLVALHRLHWETTRLIIEIANSQSQPPVPETVPFDPIFDVRLYGEYPHILTFLLILLSSCALQMTQMREVTSRTRSSADRRKSTSRRGPLLFMRMFPRGRCSKALAGSSKLTARASFAIRRKSSYMKMSSRHSSVPSSCMSSPGWLFGQMPELIAWLWGSTAPRWLISLSAVRELAFPFPLTQ